MSGYLIRGGEVCDGSGEAPAKLDVRIRGTRIEQIGTALPDQGDQVVAADGLIVTPGLIDLHVHVFSGMGIYAIDPPDAGLAHGVTTMLDTGTAGALTYPAFENLVIRNAAEDIYALLNISMIGCINGHPDIKPYLGDLSDGRYADVPTAMRCIEKYRGRLIGVKVRLTSGLADGRLENEQAGLRGAVEVARQTGLPLMVHHVLSQIPSPQVLDNLREGDILTHLYHPHEDRPFSKHDGAPSAALKAARERGVICDVGHGVGSFGWDVAEPACQQHGFWPDTISTDVHRFNLNGPVYDLPTTMSKFLHLGMPLPQVIRATTSAPARAMRLEATFGRLAVGRQADVTLLKLQPGQWSLADVQGKQRTVERLLVPIRVFKRGVPGECVSLNEVPAPR